MVEPVPFLSFLETIGILSTLIFVLSSMLAMGFSLTVQQILVPLRNTKLVIFSIVANFIFIPMLAPYLSFLWLSLWFISQTLLMSSGLQRLW